MDIEMDEAMTPEEQEMCSGAEAAAMDEIPETGDDALDNAIRRWLQWDRNEKTRAEVLHWAAEAKASCLGGDGVGDTADNTTLKELRCRMLDRIAFGTAGLRGKMRAGFDSMNELVIVQTAQGFCRYVEAQFESVVDRETRGVVIGYDGRYNSRRFAELTAAIFVQAGIRVWLYGRVVPTPFVPFAIVQKRCLAGVMVTASHNPKDDNGYKVYWSNGAQIISPIDKGIQAAIIANLVPDESSWNSDVLLSGHSLLSDPYADMFAAYYKALLPYVPNELQQINAASNLRFVYTAMHGVGYPFVEEAFRVAQLKPLIAVLEQRDPDPDFPTVHFPNPEEGKSSLILACKKADAEQVDIILANDPDADRLACAIKQPDGIWKILTGNELGALLGWWAIELHKRLQPQTPLADCYMIASTVSSKILRSMSLVEGFHFEETLTGFKWMANLAVELMAAGKQVLFAFEEAIGFMFSTNVLDKDGVSAACHLATMASYLQVNEQMTLAEKLKQLYSKYGYHCTRASYFLCYEPPVIKRIFERLRHYDNTSAAEAQAYSYARSILDGKYAIQHVRDLTTGYDDAQPDGKARLPTSASSQMITYTFANGTVVTLRTSGTEPKIKYYAEMCATPAQTDWQQLQETLDEMIAAIVAEFLQPHVNNLQCKSD